MPSLPKTWLTLVILLVLCASQDAAAKKKSGEKGAKRDLSPDSAELRRSGRSADPVAWHDRVNVHFKAGNKDAAANLLSDAAREFPHQPDLAFNHAYVRCGLKLRGGVSCSESAFRKRLTVLDVPLQVRTAAIRHGDQSFGTALSRKAGTPEQGQRGRCDVEAREEVDRPADQELCQGLSHRRRGQRHNLPPPACKCWARVCAQSFWFEPALALTLRRKQVRLTDATLGDAAAEVDPVARARVALTVYPWRLGAGIWKRSARPRSAQGGLAAQFPVLRLICTTLITCTRGNGCPHAASGRVRLVRGEGRGVPT